MEFQPMSPEQVERTMQFLLQSHAQFEANFARFSQKTEVDFARLSEGLLGLTALHNQTEREVRDLANSVGVVREGLVALTGIVGRMSERVEQVGARVDERLDRLALAQDRLALAQEQTDRQIKETDRQIHELGAHFTRHVREDHRRP